ncbi:MAG: galactokinase [Streptosporangiaceae bacterium]
MSTVRAAAAGWFFGLYGAEPDGVWHAPGRANLIGEHTDYNDGFVLPFALAQGVRAAASRRDDGLLELCSRQAPGRVIRVDIGSLTPGLIGGWAAYPAGVAWALREAGHRIGGARLAFDSDLPEGAGLSSSAAIECATAIALTDLYGVDVPRAELARLAQRAENDFVGVPCGIMDQSASMLCVRGHALLLDCRSLATAQVPFDVTSAGLELLILDTKVRHELGDSGYTDRRRARHVVTDDRRVGEVAALLRRGAIGEVGPLLTESHASLRDDFEISWPEADVAVQAVEASGALGARMMGGGFGGSVIAIGPARRTAAMVAAATAGFRDRGWPGPAVVPAAPSAGAHRLR